MAAVLALLSAIVYGSADFVGGLTSRRAGALPVVAWSQLVGAGFILALLPLVGYVPPTAHALLWGGAAGVGGVGGILLLYRGLAVGQMSLVAPLTAVLAATVPVLVGTALGDRPSAPAWTGIVLGLAAVVLVSRPPRAAVTRAPVASAGPADRSRQASPARRFDRSRPVDPDGRMDPVGGTDGAGRAGRIGARPPGLVEAVAAGSCFGLFFVLLDQAGPAGLWPLVGARVQVLVLLAVAALAGRDLRVPRPGWGGVALAGFLDQAANVLYLLAVRRGLLSLVAVLASLYPAATVVLARLLLGERLSGARVAGLACAGAGVVLIAAG